MNTTSKPGPNILTPRQIEIVRLIAGGETTIGAGYTIGISDKTVEYHRAQVFKRLKINSVTELIHWALACKLVPNMFEVKKKTVSQIIEVTPKAQKLIENAPKPNMAVINNLKILKDISIVPTVRAKKVVGGPSTVAPKKVGGMRKGYNSKEFQFADAVSSV